MILDGGLIAVRYRTDVVGNDVQHEKHPAFVAGGCQRFEVRLHAPSPDEILVLNHTAESAQTHQPSPSSHTDHAGMLLHWELQGRRIELTSVPRCGSTSWKSAAQ